MVEARAAWQVYPPMARRIAGGIGRGPTSGHVAEPKTVVLAPVPLADDQVAGLAHISTAPTHTRPTEVMT